MQLVADSGHLLTGLAIHAVTHPLQVPLWIDLTSVVIAAVAGAAVAVEERLDPVGVILLAVIMGLGGGIIRDLLLGLRPVAVTNHYYLPTVTVAALAGYLFASLLRRFGTPFVVLDAMATGLFTVVGAEKALLYDLPYPLAIFIGVAAGRRRRLVRRPDRRTPRGDGPPRAPGTPRSPGRRRLLHRTRRL